MTAAKSHFGKLKIIAIIASLAGLAFILSPTFSLSQLQNSGENADASNANNKLTANDLLGSDIQQEQNDSTMADKISDEDLAQCNSPNASVHDILANYDNGNNISKKDATDRKIAADILIGELCNRPALIHEISSAGDSGLNLVAYACDASSGRIGTAALQDSLSSYSKIYCDSAREVILNKTDSFLETIQEFRTDYLPLLAAQDNSNGTDTSFAEYNNNNSITASNPNSSSNSTNPDVLGSFNLATMSRTLDKVDDLLTESRTLLNVDKYYDAAKSLDNASKNFRQIFDG